MAETLGRPRSTYTSAADRNSMPITAGMSDAINGRNMSAYMEIKKEIYRECLKGRGWTFEEVPASD